VSRPFGKFVMLGREAERPGVKCSHCGRMVNTDNHDPALIQHAACSICIRQGKCVHEPK